MLLDFGEALGLAATHSHVGLHWVVVQVESKLFGREVTLRDPGRELINRDRVIAETNDTVHLGYQEGWARRLVNKTEAHLSFGLTNRCSVSANDTINAARAVLDVESLSVGLEGGASTLIEPAVSQASNGVAALVINPQVGGAGIRNDSESLSRSSNGDLAEVLGVHVVLHLDVVGVVSDGVHR